MHEKTKLSRGHRPHLGQKLGLVLPGVVLAKGCEFLLVSLGEGVAQNSHGWPEATQFYGKRCIVLFTRLKLC